MSQSVGGSGSLEQLLERMDSRTTLKKIELKEKTWTNEPFPALSRCVACQTYVPALTLAQHTSLCKEINDNVLCIRTLRYLREQHDDATIKIRELKADNENKYREEHRMEQVTQDGPVTVRK